MCNVDKSQNTAWKEVSSKSTYRMTMPIWSSRIGTPHIWQNQGSGAFRCIHLPKPASAHSKCVCFTVGIFTLKTKHWTQFNDTLVQVFKGKCKDVSALFFEIHQKTMGRVSGHTVWRTHCKPAGDPPACERLHKHVHVSMSALLANEKRKGPLAEERKASRGVCYSGTLFTVSVWGLGIQTPT